MRQRVKREMILWHYYNLMWRDVIEERESFVWMGAYVYIEREREREATSCH